MKNLFSIASVVLTALLLTSCVGMRVGGNFGSERFKYNNTDSFRPSEVKSDITKASNTETNSETGFYVGISFIDISIADKFELQPEVNYVGIKDLDQIQAPVLIKYNAADKINLYAGPNFGMILDTPQGINSFNIGFDVGVSYDISDSFLIETRYNHGFSNLIENAPSDVSIKLSNIQVGIAYRFNR